MRHTDTVDRAHVLLPAAAWAEKSGTVTNSERIISRQRDFLPMPGEAKPDWWIVCEVARRMGFGAGFDFHSAAAIFREHAALTAYENDGERVLNLEGLADLSDADYDAFEPLRWPVYSTEALRAAGAMPAHTDSRRLFADSVYPTADGKARLIAVRPRGPANAVSEQWPLALNTGRVRDHWHTMTRTAKSARLSAHIPEPFVEVHPRDAKRFEVADGAIATVATALGQAHVRTIVSAGQREGTLFVPMHWNDQFAAKARVGALANPAVCPISGEPEFKHTPAAIAPFEAAWHGFILASRPLRLNGEASIDYWVKVPGERFYRYEIAGLQTPDDWAATARGWIGVGERMADWLDATDTAAGPYRAAHIDAGHIEACLFVAPEPAALPDRSWLASLFTGEPIAEGERAGLLAGRPADASKDVGPQVCSCFGIGRNTIARAIREDGLNSVAAVGEALNAGTNCGSCKPEIAALIAEASEK
jgi:assimilatory nitrate reductase catalytic subunit